MIVERAALLVIGLDAAERTLIERWCASGDLPNLKSLRERAAWGELRTPPGLGDDAVWASFYTGSAPGAHGRYFWQRLDRGGDTAMFRDHDHVREPFWVSLSRAGKRVAVVDVPKCPLTPGLNGVQIADWLVHGRDHSHPLSWPDGLASEWIAKYGADDTDVVEGDWLCRVEAISPMEREKLLPRLLSSVHRKRAACLDLLQQGPWDLFLAVFKEAHCAGHQLWNHPGQREVYRELDAAVGALIDAAGPEARVLVFSDLGMSANQTGEHLLSEALYRLNRSRGVPWRHRFLSFAYRVEHNEISGAVRINLRGRDRWGRVPCDRYAEVCSWLCDELRQLVNPATGRPAVREVLRSDDLYPGPQRDHLPDLWVVWEREAPIHALVSPTIGTVQAADPHYREGNHVGGGFYVVSGEETAPAIDIADLATKICDYAASRESATPRPR